MLTKSYIQDNLKSLDTKYKKSKSLKDNLFFSKLAILELCGWLEESMDGIFESYAKKHIKSKQNLGTIRGTIKHNSGFAYERNFKGILIKLIGIVVFERLEKDIDSAKLVLFTSTLSSLKIKRDSEAHTHIKGVTKSIDSPSMTISHFTKLYDGLLEFEKALKALKP